MRLQNRATHKTGRLVSWPGLEKGRHETRGKEGVEWSGGREGEDSLSLSLGKMDE